MRKPFEDSQALLRKTGYRWNKELADNIVFGGEVVVVDYYPGGSYSDNGGQNYEPANTTIRERWGRFGSAMDRALRQAREKHPELWKAVERVPRSDRQAKEILEIAAAIDVIAVGLLPAVEAEMALEDEQRRATARERQMQEAADRVTSRIVAEVMLLAEEGALDGERKFGRLKSLSDELRSFRDGGQAPDPDPSPRP